MDSTLPWYLRAVAFAGKWLAIAGTLTVGFALWQTWGTGLLAARDQQRLAREFAEQISAAPVPVELGLGGTATEPDPAAGGTATSDGAVPLTTVKPASAETAEGAPEVSLRMSDDRKTAYLQARWSAPVTRLRIDSIGLDKIVVLGDRYRDLLRGPGLVTTMAAPGSSTGATVIPGHRTTYGAPFFDLDKVDVGDIVRLDTFYGAFRYKVTVVEVVDPKDKRLTEWTYEPSLTLYTCHPKYSSRERLLVRAVPVSPIANIPIMVDPGGGYEGLDSVPMQDPAAEGAPSEPPGVAPGTVTGGDAVPEVEEPGRLGSAGSSATVGPKKDLVAARDAQLAAEAGWSTSTGEWLRIAAWFALFAAVRFAAVLAHRRRWWYALGLWVALAPVTLMLYLAVGRVLPAGV